SAISICGQSPAPEWYSSAKCWTTLMKASGSRLATRVIGGVLCSPARKICATRCPFFGKFFWSAREGVGSGLTSQFFGPPTVLVTLFVELRTVKQAGLTRNATTDGANCFTRVLATIESAESLRRGFPIR